MTSGDDERRQRFAGLVLPHLDAGLNLARWLTHNDQDAQDVVQEAVLRAIRFMDGLRGADARAWWLQIVRNTCFSWLKENRPAELAVLDDADGVMHQIAAPAADEPPALAMRSAERLRINRAISALPVAYREVLVLRELDDFSYQDIARIAGIPIGTVMSRLARARRLLQLALQPGQRPVERPADAEIPKPAQRGLTP